MRKIALFIAAVAVLVVIGVDAWLSVRTMTPPALAVVGGPLNDSRATLVFLQHSRQLGRVGCDPPARRRLWLSS